MGRPEHVGDAIFLDGGGMSCGRYGAAMLRSAYQPIFDIAGDDLTLVAFEGLIRVDMNRRPVSPERLFREAGRRDRLFLECMCQALHVRNARLSSAADMPVFLNINPSIYQDEECLDREFDYLFRAMPEYGFTADRLVCEITEIAVDDAVYLTRLRDKLRDAGAKIALDDFGAEQSDSERFWLVKPDYVKIDGKMFRQICATMEARWEFRDLVGRLGRLNATVLIEGIETADQLDIARESGAALAQGYFLGRPEILPHSTDLPRETANAGQRLEAV